ncbi:MAG: alpha/beta hydrolase [Acidobacteriaceae bacterium]|nr:alpha/beta hydrolase [Acidobacteriaceae bacterium]
MKRVFLLSTVAMLAVCSVNAQDISGDWQGTLKAGPKQLRLILNMVHDHEGNWKATLFSIDQQPDGVPVDSVAIQDSTLKFAVSAVRGSYEGKISADRNSITGKWTQGLSLPLDFERATKETAWPRDPSPHTVHFISVDKDVKLEVLDWGGSGRPVVLLTGLGNNAHIFDKFAPKLIGNYHVYAITRRGFGASSAPVPDSKNYSADRLGDDVLAVCDALKLNRPVLIGHSIAGEELSSVGSRYAEKVAGLIYLDAAYSYAYYDRSRGDLLIDSLDVERKLRLLRPGSGQRDQKRLIQELLEADLPQVEKDLREEQEDVKVMPAAMATAQSATISPAGQAILAGEQKYANIPVPILAIYAVPHDIGQFLASDASSRLAFEHRDQITTGAQATALETGIPSAHVVRLPHASHFVFFSNEADVLREIDAFLSKVP